jgi:glutamate-1-semialdehyde 2,1-aminomutase
MVSIGSIFWLSFAGKKSIQRADQIDPDMSLFNKLFNGLLERGVYLGPSGYEVGFISIAHSDDELNIAGDAFCDALDKIYK